MQCKATRAKKEKYPIILVGSRSRTASWCKFGESLRKAREAEGRGRPEGRAEATAEDGAGEERGTVLEQEGEVNLKQRCGEERIAFAVSLVVLKGGARGWWGPLQRPGSVAGWSDKGRQGKRANSNPKPQKKGKADGPTVGDLYPLPEEQPPKKLFTLLIKLF